MNDIKYAYYNTTKGYRVVGGTAAHFLKADGSIDNTLYTSQSYVSNNFIPKSHPVYNITQAKINNWDSAFGWGPHVGKYVNRNSYGAPTNCNFVEDGVATGYIWSNAPVSIGIATLITIVYSPDWITQSFELIGASITVYKRNRYNGTTWSPWIEVTNSATGYVTLSTPQNITEPKSFTHALPLKFKNPSTKSWTFHKTAGNGSFILAPSATVNNEDWDWSNQIEFRDDGVVRANRLMTVGGTDSNVALGNGILANFNNDILNVGGVIRLHPQEYRINPPIYYVDIDDSNRLIHIINKTEKAIINLKGLYPRQEYVIYNFDIYDLEILIFDNPVYTVSSQRYVRFYVTEILEVIVEESFPCSRIW